MRELGSIRVPTLTGQWLTTWLSACKSRGVRLNTLTTRYGVLKAALRRAAVDELIPTVPPFPRFHVDYVRRGFFEPDEAAAVIAELHEPLNDIARFAYSTGWRSEEVLGLHWGWINRTVGTITLPAEMEKTKTPRVVPYGDHPELVAVLERRWRRRAFGCPLVFHRQGRAIVSFGWAWRSACERAGLPGRHFHDFRRTVLRDTVAGGADLGTAMALTGHRSVKTALRYDIVDAKMARRALGHLTAYRQQAARERTPRGQPAEVRGNHPRTRVWRALDAPRQGHGGARAWRPP